MTQFSFSDSLDGAACALRYTSQKGPDEEQVFRLSGHRSSETEGQRFLIVIRRSPCNSDPLASDVYFKIRGHET